MLYASVLTSKRFSVFVLSFFSILFAFHALAQTPTITYPASTLAFTTGAAISPVTPNSSGVAGGLTFSDPVTLGGLNGNFDLDPFGNLWYGTTYLAVNRRVSGFQIIQNPYTSSGLTSDRDGNMYLINNYTLKRIDAGSTNIYNVAQGPSTVSALAVGIDGTVWIAEGYGTGSGTVSKRLPGGSFAQVCTGEFGGIVVGKDGSAYLAEGYSNRIRKISPGSSTPVDWGPALRGVKGLAMDESGNIYAINIGDNGYYDVTIIPPGDGNGARTKITLPANFQPTNVAWSADGRIYYSQYSSLSYTDIQYVEKRSGYSIYPNLPLGMNFDPATGVISGTPSVSVPERTYTVQAFNASGATSTTLKIRTGTNSTLSNLSTAQGSLSPAFSASTTDYTMTVASNVTKLNLSPSSTDASTKVTIAGNVVAIGGTSADIPLNNGDNVINVLVESGNGQSSKTYKLTITRTIDVELGVTLTNNQTEYVSGSSSTYTLQVKNNGTSNVPAAAVTGSFLTGATWSASFTGGATGTANGSGNISQTVNLPAGAQVTYTVLVSTSSTQAGDVIAVATVGVSAPYKDTNSGNDLTSDTDTGKPTFRAVNDFSAYPAFTAVYNQPSASILYFLSASNLKSQILVTPPTGYEVSADNVTFAGTLSVGDIGRQNNPAFYIRLKAGIPAGTYSGNFIFTTTGAAQVNAATLPATVSRASNAITFSLDPKTYGQADFAPGASSSNTADPVTYVSDNPSVATIVAGKIHLTGAGTANITASQVAGTNYEAPAPVSRVLTVSKLAVTVQALARSKVYGTAEPTLAYTVTPSLVTGDSFSGTLSRSAGEDAGNYAIGQNTLALNANKYTLTFQGNTFAITPKPVTVSIQAQTKIYGEADPELTYSVSPALMTGDAFTGALSRAAGEGVGYHDILQNTLTPGPNYTMTLNTNKLLIYQKTIIVWANAQSKIYGSADPVLNYAISQELVGSDTFTGSLQRTAGENVGTYNIGQGSLALSPNYSLVYVRANFSIDQQTVAVSAVAQNKVYGAADPALTYTFTPALRTGDAFSGNLDRLAGENVGDYAIGQGSLALSSNYTLNYTAANLSIGKKSISVTAQAGTKTYGDSDPVLTYAFSPALVSGDAFSGNLSRNPGEIIGDYVINQGSLSLSGNYLLNYSPANLSIGKKTIAVNAISSSKTYGDADPALTYTYTPALISGDSFTGNLSRAPGEAIGNYVIGQGDLALNGNYTLNYSPANLGIGRKTISVAAVANSKTYGEADPLLSYTFTPALISGDAFTGNISRVAGEHVGNYAIGQGNLALDGNYTLNYSPADLSIAKKTIAVAAVATSKTYGDADPVLTYTFSPALINGDSFTGNLSRTAGENTGDYAINQASLALSTDYTLSYTSANLSITRKTITVTAAAKTKTYGDADPALTYTFTPVLNFRDGFSGSLSRAAGKQAGLYAIAQNTLTLSNNYTLNYVPANLTITERALAITASAASKVYDGNTNATVSFSDNRVSGDVLTVSATSASFDTKNTGTGKTVTVSGITIGGADAANYTCNAGASTLASITARALTITATAADKVYDGSTVTTARFADNRVSGDILSAIASRVNFDTKNTGTGKTVIANGISLTGTDAGNYSYNTSASTTASISPKVLTISAGAASKVYDGNAMATATLTDNRVAGDLFTATAGSVSFDTKNAGRGKTVTVKDIRISGTDAANYSYNTLATTTADVTLKMLDIAAIAASKVYDGTTAAAVTLTDNRVAGDQLTASALSATFDTKNSGSNKPVAVSGITIGGTDAANYSYNNTASSTANITAKALTIMADNKLRLQGLANPALTASYSGLINGEGSSNALAIPPTLNTTATTASMPGSYPIIPSGAVASNGNYAIAYVNGTLTVAQGNVTGISLAATTLYENRPAATLAATLGSTSDDANSTFTYTLVPGAGSADNSRFSISGNQVLTSGPLDFEAQASYEIRVRSSTQFGFFTERSFNILVSDVNEQPTMNTVANQSICYTAGTQFINIGGIGPGPETAQSTSVAVSSTNNALFSSLSIEKSGAGAAVLSYRIKDGASGVATISVTVTDNGGTANGGVDAFTGSFSITVNPLPVLAISTSTGSTSLSKGEQAGLRADAPGAASYTWANALGIISGQNSAVLTIRPTQTTTYTVTATNATGCSSSGQVTIEVRDDFQAVKAPNILTPDGDGYNDTWVVANIDQYPNAEVKIYDRAGRVFYTRKNYDNSWDGTYNGQPLPEGTYYYLIDYGQAKYKAKGFITIVRNR